MLDNHLKNLRGYFSKPRRETASSCPLLSRGIVDTLKREDVNQKRKIRTRRSFFLRSIIFTTSDSAPSRECFFRDLGKRGVYLSGSSQLQEELHSARHQGRKMMKRWQASRRAKKHQRTRGETHTAQQKSNESARIQRELLGRSPLTAPHFCHLVFPSRARMTAQLIEQLPTVVEAVPTRYRYCLLLQPHLFFLHSHVLKLLHPFFAFLVSLPNVSSLSL